jgi:hydroxymethylbilane synthase
MSARTLRIATRQSPLALTQTRHVMDLLQRANPDCRFELLPIRTTGDATQGKPLAGFGGVGVFVKELEISLRDKSADIAVHSLKDVPSTIAEGMVLAAFPERENPCDVLLTPDSRVLMDIPQGARIGTGSPRRIVQLRSLRPDFRFEGIRGNVDTRIRKMHEGQYDGIMLAAAGLTRLGIAFADSTVLTTRQCTPACGQGILGIECRADDAGAFAAVNRINNPAIEVEATVERDFMRHVGAGCATPVAAIARVTGARVTASAMGGDVSTGAIARVDIDVASDAFRDAGTMLADKLLALCAQRGISFTRESDKEAQ